ncbi:cation transport regulator-like protein 1 [Asbolus verrucosus]|uniref:glutathione-specific gamma-glutamylcyclotransferase n=1 Tax=Asbolus verrucosus TaxID=1661398 RepID=A0A482VU95_ASBVE|nr:cation transport regulator-like protein 1 [Asbolus verrucosus]
MALESASVAVLEDEVFHSETKALWVFAYGSLCWKPGFQFHKAVTGYVQGFQRRFWQGNTTHRGTEDKGLVYGVAFAISGEAAVPYLSKRECELGGYTSVFTNFYPINGEPFKVLLYVATPKNPLWLGDAHVSDIAGQILECRGPSGYNVEYVLRLANFMKHHFPDQDDQHLYSLEKEVLKRVEEKNMCLKTLMGDGEGCVTFVKEERRRSTDNSDENQERIETFQHTTRVPEKTLRCLNI